MKPKKLKCPACDKPAIKWHREVRWMCDACWQTPAAVVIARKNGITEEELENYKEGE